MTPLCRELGPIVAALFDHVQRHVRSYSDAGFALFLGVERSTVSRWRNAGENCPVEIVHQLARFTGRADIVWGFLVIADDLTVSSAPEAGAPERGVIAAIQEAGELVATLGRAIADSRVDRDEARAALPTIRDLQRRLDTVEADFTKAASA